MTSSLSCAQWFKMDMNHNKVSLPLKLETSCQVGEGDLGGKGEV